MRQPVSRTILGNGTIPAHTSILALLYFRNYVKVLQYYRNITINSSLDEHILYLLVLIVVEGTKKAFKIRRQSHNGRTCSAGIDCWKKIVLLWVYVLIAMLHIYDTC